MNRIIVPTGYMGSGSSAVTDLVAEFKDCQNEHKSYEYVLLHCPNGLFDLEDKLLLGNNALRSDEALRTFKKQMKKLYDKKFWWVGNYKDIIGPGFMEKTNTFIAGLEEYRYNGYWYMHEELNTSMFWKLLFRKPFKMLTFNKIHFKKILKYDDGMKVSFINKENFYKYAHDYIYSIIDLLSHGKDNVILDQFLLPFNLYRVDRYFDDRLRVIVVERDPRDIFILNKYIWQEKQIGVPFPLDVDLFCDFYKAMRESEIKTDSNKILRIRFEDLIYNYDTEVKKIMKFLNYKASDHIYKKKRFNPALSIKNTQLFNNNVYSKEVLVIEKKLKSYLYSFPYALCNEVQESVEFE